MPCNPFPSVSTWLAPQSTLLNTKTCADTLALDSRVLSSDDSNAWAKDSNSVYATFLPSDQGQEKEEECASHVEYDRRGALLSEESPSSPLPSSHDVGIVSISNEGTSALMALVSSPVAMTASRLPSSSHSRLLVPAMASPFTPMNVPGSPVLSSNPQHFQQTDIAPVSLPALAPVEDRFDARAAPAPQAAAPVAAISEEWYPPVNGVVDVTFQEPEQAITYISLLSFCKRRAVPPAFRGYFYSLVRKVPVHLQYLGVFAHVVHIQSFFTLLDDGRIVEISNMRNAEGYWLVPESVLLAFSLKFQWRMWTMQSGTSSRMILAIARFRKSERTVNRVRILLVPILILRLALSISDRLPLLLRRMMMVIGRSVDANIWHLLVLSWLPSSRSFYYLCVVHLPWEPAPSRDWL